MLFKQSLGQNIIDNLIIIFESFIKEINLPTGRFSNQWTALTKRSWFWCSYIFLFSFTKIKPHLSKKKEKYLVIVEIV